MLSEFFIDAGDIFQSLTFNLLSKKSTELLERVSQASDMVEDAPGAITKNVSFRIDEEDLKNIRADAEDFCKPYIADYNRIKESDARIRDINRDVLGDSVFLDKLMPSVQTTEVISENELYLTPEILAKVNIQCFIKTLLIYAQNSTAIKQVYKRYTVTNDFGDINNSKAIQKISAYVIEKLEGDLGSITVEDCIHYVCCCCEIGLLAEKAPNIENKIKNNLGIEFEKECLLTLLENGYEARETPKTGDFGADLIASKEGLSFAIQCKNHGKPIGVSAIQEAHSGKEYYEVDFSVVVSKSAFTSSALKLAGKLNVICTTTVKLGSLTEICDDYL